MKKRKTIATALLLLITLYIPLSCSNQSKDFEMVGTVLVKYNGSAVNVTIPSGVTSIGDWAFAFCNRLTGITIPSSVTSIGNNAFAYCKSLTGITIPSSVTSIGYDAFAFCKSLTGITVDSQNSAYSSVDGVLFNKDITDLVAYPAGKQERSYTIPSSVTSIGNEAFDSCTSLTSITIPSSVISIRSNAFEWCRSLASITVDSQNSAYSSVDGVLFNKDITDLVAYPAGKQERSYTIPSSVTSIGDDAFGFCRSLTGITIPSSVTSIGHGAFGFCRSLTGITIPSSVISIRSSAFLECSSLTSITVDSQNSAYSSVDGVLFNKDITDLVAYPAGKQERSYTIPSSVTSIRNWAFDSCTSLTSITIPLSVTSIGYGAFDNCTSLTSVTIPSSVTSIGNSAFGFCRSLTSVTVSKRTSIGKNAFPDNARITYSD